MLRYQRGFARIATVFYDEPAPNEGADIVRYRHRRNAPDGIPCSPQSTLLLDLRKPEEALFAGAKKDLRYEVRRAERDGVVTSVADAGDSRMRQQVVAFGVEWARQRGQAVPDADWFDVLAVAGVLDLSCGVGSDGSPLVWHVHYVVCRHARLVAMYTHRMGTDDRAVRQLVGRANRKLHWDNILRFQGTGLTAYDFGGWYDGRADEALLRVNAYKEEFGGEHAVQFNAEHARTARGRLAAAWRDRLGRYARTIAGRRRVS